MGLTTGNGKKGKGLSFWHQGSIESPLEVIVLSISRAVRYFLLTLTLQAVCGPHAKSQMESASRALVGGKTASAWVSALSSDNQHERDRGCFALGLLGKDEGGAVKALMKAASDAEKPVQISAVEALGRIGPEAKAAIPLLLTKVFTAENGVLTRYEAALAGIGRDAVRPLIAHLSDDLVEHRVRSVQTLVKIGPAAAAAVPAFLEQLKAFREDEADATRAMVALGAIGVEAKLATPALNKLLEQKFSEQKGVLITELLTETLTRIGDPPVEFLMKKLSSNDGDDRHEAASLLGVIGPPAGAAVPMLSKAINDKLSERPLQIQSALALSKIEPASPLCLAALIDAIKEDADRVVPALRELGPFAMPALPRLIAFARQAEPMMQTDVIKTLLEIDPDGLEIVPALMAFFESANADVRLHAAFALGEIGPGARSAVPALTRAFTRINIEYCAAYKAEACALHRNRIDQHPRSAAIRRPNHARGSEGREQGEDAPRSAGRARRFWTVGATRIAAVDRRPQWRKCRGGGASCSRTSTRAQARWCPFSGAW